MKCVYVLEDRVNESDISAIRLLDRKFDYITIGFPLKRGERGADYAQNVSFLRKNLFDSCGVSLDFFRQEEVSGFIERACADLVIFSDGRVICLK